MAVKISAPRGTQDLLPADSAYMRKIEDTIKREAALFGFKELRTPTFEHTELFNRSVGDTTDVVEKEMYTFLDKGDRSITLRPEGTAGAIRSVIENGLLNGPLPLKIYYMLSCFRYEKPQAGRLREFHQFGVEVFGADSPKADAEVILLADGIFKALGLKNISLELNSLGCKECRPNYYKKLREYFQEKKEGLCDTCKGRLERNPLRILDCKCPTCKEIAAGAPKGLDYICDDCRTHFEGLLKLLDSCGMKYTINKDIVRGLDYYVRTVFEFVSNDLGSQSTVCGGGRYDGLCESLGGQAVSSLGFGMGLERLSMICKKQGVSFPDDEKCQIYIASIGERAETEAFRLTSMLRENGVAAECSISGKGLKAQMKYADKIGAELSMVLGDDEIDSGVAIIKDMKSGEKREAPLSDKLIDAIDDMLVGKIEETMLSDIDGNLFR